MTFAVPRAELIDALNGLFRFYGHGGLVDVAAKDGLVMLVAEHRTVTFPVTILEPGHIRMRRGALRAPRAKVRKYTGANVMITITNAGPDLNTDLGTEVQFRLEEPKHATAPSDVYMSIGSNICADG